ncbi:MAG TPA: RHS repeat-associated core domain-containing protein, partial [Myxococcota bacterium]|nr:RHS repeat-associated core domain-containing protein [Myxococcota bacterium]
YWGYRYYSPRLGRWISRDPIDERKGGSSYAMLSNDVVNKSDYLGLFGVCKLGTPGWIYSAVGCFPCRHRVDVECRTCEYHAAPADKSQTRMVTYATVKGACVAWWKSPPVPTCPAATGPTTAPQECEQAIKNPTKQNCRDCCQALYSRKLQIDECQKGCDNLK